MKAKFALLLLPAFMALTSCGFKPAVNDRTLLEDTTAHSDIFGNHDVVGGQLAIKKRAGGEAITEPKIGYQISYNSSTDKLAIRFVAALKEFNVRAYWRRGVASSDGTTLQNKNFSDTTRESEQYYLSLSDGHKTITAGADEYAGYAGFVVYTIHNIPYTSNKNVYVAAYVNLVGDAEGDTSDTHNNSKGLAVKIEKKDNYTSANAFAFNPTVTSHFLQGTINGTLRSGDTLFYQTGGEEGTNFCSYTGLHLLKTDSFGSFYYKQDNIFQYFGHKTYFDVADTKNSFRESSLSGYSTPFFEGDYNLYVSSGYGNHIYISSSNLVDTAHPTIYLHPGVWAAGVEEFAIYMWGDGGNAWADMTKVGNIRGVDIYSYDGFDTSKYSSYKFGRMKIGRPGNGWQYAGEGVPEENVQIFNESGNYTYADLVASPYNVSKINDWNSNSGWQHFFDIA